jgi:hypothetical protein
VTDYLDEGLQYQFKVRARNYWGWAEFSDILSIKTATWPDEMLAVTTSVDVATGGIRIDWKEPFDNKQTITAYEV